MHHQVQVYILFRPFNVLSQTTLNFLRKSKLLSCNRINSLKVSSLGHFVKFLKKHFSQKWFDNDEFDTAENQISIDRQGESLGQSLCLTGNNLSSFLVGRKISEKQFRQPRNLIYLVFYTYFVCLKGKIEAVVPIVLLPNKLNTRLFYVLS